MQKMKPEWSKSYIIRPKDNLISHIYIKEKDKFKASYENVSCKIFVQQKMAKFMFYGIRNRKKWTG